MQVRGHGRSQLVPIIAGASDDARDRTEVSEVYLQLRDLILRGDPHAHGWAPSTELPHVWGVLVEVGLADGPATLVALVDGTTSLYLGDGGATIGAGEVSDIAMASRDLLRAVEDAASALRPVWEFPVPERGRVRLVALTYTGPMGADAAENEVAAGKGPLAAVYERSGRVLAGIHRLEAAMPGAREP